MIDYERLTNAVKDVLLDWETYDELENIVHNAELCWDGTAILVKSTDFEFVFDLISYECKSVSTMDIIEEL